MNSNINKNAAITFIISALLGAILFSYLTSGETTSSGSEGAAIGGVVRLLFFSLLGGVPIINYIIYIIPSDRLLFASFLAGIVSGFFAGKDRLTSIKAAITGVIIGFFFMAPFFIYTSFPVQPSWFSVLYGITLIFVVFIAIPAIRIKGLRKTAITGLILLVFIFSMYIYTHPRYSYPTWSVIFPSLILNSISVIIIAIAGGIVGGWIRRRRPY